MFVVFGGIAVRWWPRVAWVHIPFLVWGAIVSLAGWVCPLTPLENHFRGLAGEIGYDGTFLEQYIAPIVYPDGLTRDLQIIAGFALPIWNVLVYAWVVWRRRGSFTG